jgi:pterin-4a-carbinolamine dehydratase
MRALLQAKVIVLNLLMTITDDSAQGVAAINTKCVPCSSLDRSHLIPIDVIRERVQKELPLWSVRGRAAKDTVVAGSVVTADDDDNNKDSGFESMLFRKFTAKNFQAALDAINAMGAIAEAESHHPNFHLTNYRDVEVEIFTHKLGGVCENDFTLANLLDQVHIDYSPKWLKENPHHSQCTTMQD